MTTQNQESNLLLDRAEKLTSETVGQSRFLTNALDAIFDRVYLKDATGRIIYVNRAYLDSYNLAAEEVLGKFYPDFLPAEQISLCHEADQKVLQQGESVCQELRWQDHETGVDHWTESYKSPMRDPAGNIIGLVGICRDVTARRSAEEEVKRQKNLLELILETVPDQIFVKDRQRRILLANRAFHTNWGFDPDELLGQDPSKSLPAELEQLSQDSDKFVLTEGRSLCSEISLVDAGGSKQHLEIRKLPLRENGKTVGVVAVCRDLTSVKETEKRLKRNESLLLHASRLSFVGEVAAEIAHEVNQPLFSILNYAKAVENALENEDELDLETVRTWVRQIRSEATRGGKITQRLKSFIQPADTQQELADLNSVILESIELMTWEAREAAVSIEVELADDLPTLLIDCIQIQQVMVNLLKNALEALFSCSKATPRVVVTTRVVPLGVEVTVSDNGPGVSVEESVKFFEPFETTKPDGLGLGLAISKTIIEAHHGQLTHHPNPWGGATFSFTFPLED